MTLSCNAAGVPKTKTSRGRKNNFGCKIPVQIPESVLVKMETKLSITNLSRTDAGEYKCVANNSEGSNTSKPATLTVEGM